jgi:hypothetical protein
MALPNLMLRRLPDDWWCLLNVPGWESHQIEFRAEIVNGETKVTGLRVLPTGDASGTNRAVSGLRLRSLPLRQAASIVAAESEEAIWEALGAIAATEAPRHDKRAVTTVEQVAAAWNAARGRSARRQAVCEALHIQPRTADRYLKQARAAGLLDDDENGQTNA